MSERYTLSRACVECDKEKSREWNLKNKEKVNARCKKWREDNLEKSKEYQKQYQKKYREKKRLEKEKARRLKAEGLV